MLVADKDPLVVARQKKAMESKVSLFVISGKAS